MKAAYTPKSESLSALAKEKLHDTDAALGHPGYFLFVWERDNGKTEVSTVSWGSGVRCSWPIMTIYRALDKIVVSRLVGAKEWSKNKDRFFAIISEYEAKSGVEVKVEYPWPDGEEVVWLKKLRVG